MIIQSINKEKFYSQSKYNMYCSCERKFFLHYYAAYGAFEQDNSNELNYKIHLLKQLKTFDELIAYVISNSIKKLFLSSTNIRNLQKIVKSEANTILNNMALMNYEIDHHYPILMDFYYRNDNIKNLFEKFNEKLVVITNQLINNQIIQDLFALNVNNIVCQDDNVAQVNLGNIILYSNIIVCLKSKDKLNFLTFDSDNREYTTFFHKFYGFTKLYTPADKIQSYLLKLEPNIEITKINNDEVEISQTIFEIGEKYNILPKYTEDIHYLDIPCTKSIQVCKHCKFKELCL